MTAARVLIHPGKQQLADAIAARLVTTLIDALSQQEEAHLALTGGSMGSAIWASMSALPAAAAIDWSRIHVWWGDERYLPDGDPERNDVQNDGAGLATLGIPAAQVHRVLGPDASPSPEASAQAYSEAIRATGHGAWDVVLLGVGPDGHVASLFPHHPEATTTDAIAFAVHDSPKPPPTRVTLSFECLERSERVWFLVSGADKADAVRRGVEGDDPRNTPAAAVHGRRETLWLVDVEAAAEL